MPFTGAWYCFVDNKVLEKPETNEKIIYWAGVPRNSDPEHITPEELARSNFANFLQPNFVEELMKKDRHVTDDMETD